MVISSSFAFNPLPTDVLTLSGYDFFQFIKCTLGEHEANLLKKISVRATSSLLVMEDPLDIFNYNIDDDELELLKDQLCFRLKNDKFMIKPGVVSGFRSLKEALSKRLIEESKRPKKKQQLQATNNIHSSSLFSLTPTTQTEAPDLSSLTDQKAYLLRLIKKWCSDNKENFGLQTFELSDDVDFTINIDYDEASNFKASMKCKCGKIISLCAYDNKVQLSNYYKHLHSLGCDLMKEIRKAEKERRLSDNQAQQQQHSHHTAPSSFSRSNAAVSPLPVMLATSSQNSSQPISPTSTQPKQSAKRDKTTDPGSYRSSKRIRT